MAPGLIALAFTMAIVGTAWSAEPGKSPDAAAALLKEGNARFAGGKSKNPDQSIERRKEVAKGQKPFAVIITCSDSRVSPEVIFDQGLGDIFVIRVAGNVVDDHALGSIEYAIEHLGSSLVVVLGHERCGAVEAAVKGGEAEGHIESLVKAIQPAVDKVKSLGGDVLENAVKENAKEVAAAIKASEPIMKHAVDEKKAVVVSAYYDLDSGKVVFLE